MLAVGKYQKILLAIFILTLPFVNPWVRGDGVGYYAYVRSMLVEGHLNFEQDWLHGNASFQMFRVGPDNKPKPGDYTATGNLVNHFAVGPAILWAPFLIVVHGGVLAADRLGPHIPADGFSRPYVDTMAVVTALYGFLGLLISFRLTRKYIADRWAFLATIGIWFASSLPVYMYFNPSWAHAHSAFVVALFIWYWDRTRDTRNWKQWLLLGAIGGLMMDVYYVNVVLMLLPLLESLNGYWNAYKTAKGTEFKQILLGNVLFAAAALAAFSPTLVVKKIIFGSYLDFGYTEGWFWKSPAFFKVSFSADHGLFSWTPIVVLAVVGLFLLRRYDRHLAFYVVTVFAVFWYVIGCYENWQGISSFGNRFFVSLTCLFILGLAAFFDSLAHTLQERRAVILASSLTAVLILWNLGLVYQWGTHLIPVRGPISWRQVAYNQCCVVPLTLESRLGSYVWHRREMMNEIEKTDIKQLQKTGPPPK